MSSLFIFSLAMPGFMVFLWVAGKITQLFKCKRLAKLTRRIKEGTYWSYVIRFVDGAYPVVTLAALINARAVWYNEIEADLNLYIGLGFFALISLGHPLFILGYLMSYLSKFDLEQEKV